MARNTQLSVLLTMLQAQLDSAITAAPQNQSSLFQLLSDEQKWLAGQYDWPFLEDRFDLLAPAGSRYLPFPTVDNEGNTIAMNLERPYKVEVFWTNYWNPLAYGIGSEQYNYLNSDQPGNVQDPIQNWRWSGENQVELWPINTTAQVVRFTGQRVLDPLVSSTDTADLDDQLIVLSLSWKQLKKKKQDNWDAIKKMFDDRLASIRGNYPCDPIGLVFGRGEDERMNRKRVVPIAVAGNNSK